MLTADQLTAIKARRAGITGEWHAVREFEHGLEYDLYDAGGFIVARDVDSDNAVFIASAPADVDALLAYIQELERLIEDTVDLSSAMRFGASGEPLLRNVRTNIQQDAMDTREDSE